MRYTHECGETYDIPEEFLGKRAECPACQKPFDVPACDASKPLENPGLNSAIERAYRSPGQALELKVVLQALPRSQFLLAVVAPGTPASTPSAPDGRVQVLTLPAGARIVQGTDRSGAPYLPVFSDWGEVAAFRGQESTEPAWTGVLLSWQVVEGVLAGRTDFASVIVNPGGDRILSLPRELLPLLRTDLDAAFEKLAAAASQFPPLPPLPEAGPTNYRHRCGAEHALEPSDAGSTMTCKGCGENFEAPLAAERRSVESFQRAAKRYGEQPDTRGVTREFYRLLLEAELVVACELQVPNGFIVSPSREVGPPNLPRGTKVLYSCVSDSSGQNLMIAFSDRQRWEKSAQKGARRVPVMAMPARPALFALAHGDFDGLVLDPSADWTFLVTKDQAKRLLAGELPPE